MSEYLKSMVNNIINDKTDEAVADFTRYVEVKSKTITGVNTKLAAKSTVEAESGDNNEE